MNAAEKNQAIVAAEYAKAEKLFAASMRRGARNIKKIETEEDATKAKKAAWKALDKAYSILGGGTEESAAGAAANARHEQVSLLCNDAAKALAAAKARAQAARDADIKELHQKHRESVRNDWRYLL